jgi:hypothetical protein
MFGKAWNVVMEGRSSQSISLVYVLAKPQSTQGAKRRYGISFTRKSRWGCCELMSVRWVWTREKASSSLTSCLHLQIEDWFNTCNKCIQILLISLSNQRDSRTWEIIKGSTNTTWLLFCSTRAYVTRWAQHQREAPKKSIYYGQTIMDVWSFLPVWQW